MDEPKPHDYIPGALRKVMNEVLDLVALDDKQIARLKDELSQIEAEAARRREIIAQIQDELLSRADRSA